ncbi:type IV secretory system conjugative DNA transfer family protein [Agrobacterium tumefaciens]|uniref:type IV secretory system conjugative DNA transfer family protein n=1 Tax=Agrobacterium tumefaciens TaxID=358 RepID=UPI003B9E7CD3
MVVGRTGGGKGRSVIMPIALDYPGSIVLIDIKGEAAAVTARRRREMGQEVVILEPFGRERMPRPLTRCRWQATIPMTSPMRR